MTEVTLTKKVIELAKRLNDKNMLAAADGNISYRISDRKILITPTGINKAFLKPSEICVITLDNQVLKGAPSGERLMHLEVYRNCPEAKCIVHAHPPTAIGWSVAYPEMRELPAHALSEVILAVGKIPIVPYARPGTQQMGDVLRPYLPESRVMILARHGALSWGESLEEAYNGMERLEHSAKILQIAQALGGITNLPEDEIEFLKQLRKKLGSKTL